VRTSASGRTDDDFATTGFAQELLVASGRSDDDFATTGFAQQSRVASGSHRSSKDARQQPKEQVKRAVPAPVTVSLPTALALPLVTEAPGEDAGTDGGGEPPAEQGGPAVDLNAACAQEAPVPPAQQNPPLAPDIELAFAAKVQPAGAPSTDPGVSQMRLQRENAAPAQPVLKRSTENDTADQTVVQPITAGAGSSLASYGQSFGHAEVAPPPSPAPSAPPGPVEVKVVETPPKPAAVPLKDISLQVAQSGDQKVEVRLVQQSGELRVAVRTGDSDLAHGLQQGLSDLVGRLQENGFRAEAWRPGGTAVTSGPVFESRTSPGGSQKDDSQAFSGGSHQQPDERRQSQSQRPGWVEELEQSIGGVEQSQGASYGNVS